MNDYISIQEAIEKINERARETFSLAPGYEHYLGALHDVADDLRQMSTVDAVQIVRCKDCKHRERDEIFNQSWCKGRRVRDDFFCADGERKPYTFDDAWQNLKNESEESREFFEEAERIAEELRGERKDDE